MQAGSPKSEALCFCLLHGMLRTGMCSSPGSFPCPMPRPRTLSACASNHSSAMSWHRPSSTCSGSRVQPLRRSHACMTSCARMDPVSRRGRPYTTWQGAGEGDSTVEPACAARKEKFAGCEQGAQQLATADQSNNCIRLWCSAGASLY